MDETTERGSRQPADPGVSGVGGNEASASEAGASGLGGESGRAETGASESGPAEPSTGGAYRASHPPPQLRRSRDDRVIAGVCAALGRYTDVDPVIYRVTLAVLSVFGGAGLLLYLLGWLLIPAEGTAGSLLDHAARRGADGRPSVPVLLGIGLAVLIVTGIVADNGNAGFALVLVGTVAVLVHRARRSSGPPPVDDSWNLPNSGTGAAVPGLYAPYGAEMPARTWPPVAGVAAKSAQPRRVRSVLGLLTGSISLLVVGALLLAANLAGRSVSLSTVLASALVVIGLGLVIGTRYGRSRALIVLGALLAAATMVAAAISVPLAGGVGERVWVPTSVAELAPAYRLGVGDGTLDLSAVSGADLSAVSGADGRAVAASVGAGQLRVLVPRNLDVTVHGRAGAGNVVLFGDNNAGRNLDRRRSDPGVASTGSINLDVRVGVGQVEVDRA